MSSNVFLSSVVSVPRRFQRSTKLDADLHQSSTLDGYILQESCLQCLDVMADFIQNTKQRAFTWTGSYGSGKSSLALFLCSLLGDDEEMKAKALKILGRPTKKTNLIHKVFATGNFGNVVTLIGHNRRLNEDFAKAIGQDFSGVSDRVLINKFIKHYSRKNGVIVVIDELGKYLEGGNADNCYFLQELAEAVNRTSSNIIVLGILHQAFDAYAYNLSKAQRDEWAKVQGRYVDIPLLSGAEEVLQLLDKSIVSKRGFQQPDMTRAITAVIDELSKTRKLDKANYLSVFSGVYPLNPVTAVLLGVLSRHSFLQNTRTVFNFLTSKEPFGFNVFLGTTPLDRAEELYSLDVLWDYLRSNFEHSILAQPSEGHRWMVAVDCVDRALTFASQEVIRVVKTIAMLDLFKRGSGLEPSLAILEAALFPMPAKDVKEAVDSLIENKIVIFRKHLNAYALYEGSDFNFETSLSEILSRGEEVDIASLQINLKLPPIIARRHYATSGSLRWFNREVCLSHNLQAELRAKPPKSLTGRIILCLDEDNIAIEAIKSTLKEIADPTIFVGTSNSAKNFLDIAKEYQALELMSKDSELEGDPVARKEVSFQKDLLASRLREGISKSFVNLTLWNVNGPYHVGNAQDLNSVLSDVCDEIFCDAPTIINELINREQLSSNITRARRLLMRAMLEHQSEEKLGIKEFPPEMMIYLTVLKSSGLHKFDETSQKWYFDTSTTSGPYAKLWKATNKFFKANEKPSLTELYEFWGARPFGIKAGVRPILALTYFLANSQSLSIYVQDAFQADISIDMLDSWQIDAKSVRFRYVDDAVGKSGMLEVFARGLSSEYPNVPLPDSSALTVARAIVRIVLTCPKWALNTAKLSDQTKSFRNAVVNAWDPLQLLFVDLPKIFNTDDAQTLAQATLKSLKEIQGVSPNMLSHVKAYILKALDAEHDSLEKINERAKAIHGLAGHMQMEAFIGRLSVFNGTDLAIEGIISLAAAKPKHLWNDRDIEISLTKISQWALDFRHLESLALLRNRASSRRMVSIVVAGEHGTSDCILDIPVEKSPEVEQASHELHRWLQKLPKDIAMAALIDQNISFFKDK